MKYKGYEIKPVYLPGSNFKIMKNGTVKAIKPKPVDIDYFTTVDIRTGEQLPNSSTCEEAKEFIDRYTKL